MRLFLQALISATFLTFSGIEASAQESAPGPLRVERQNVLTGAKNLTLTTDKGTKIQKMVIE